MRVVFMGSPPFAVPVFQALSDSRHSLVALVTPPDKPKGRGRKLEQSPLVETARARGVRILQPPSAREAAFVAEVRALAPDVLLVASYGEILKRELLDLAPHGALNVHASLLPRHRGASPIQAAILAGDAETGVTIQRMVLKLDEGDVLLAVKTPIGEHENSGELLERLSHFGGDASVHALELLESGEARFTPQDPALATYAKKIKKEDGRVDWSQSAESISRLVRAFTPWPGARTIEPHGSGLSASTLAGAESSAQGLAAREQVGGERAANKSNGSARDGSGNAAGESNASARTGGEPAPEHELVLLDVRIDTARPSDACRGVAPGSILASKTALVVATGTRALEIRALKPAGKGRMDGAAWLRGARLEAGARLGS